MGNKALIYNKKVKDNLEESFTHFSRLQNAFNEIEKKHSFPLDLNSYKKILNSINDIAFTDQIIYRFSKLQDCMGGKLFKAILLYQGENVDKPFLDILNRLENMSILDVNKWFELRDLRNEVTHQYDNNNKTVINILNEIHNQKIELQKILDNIQKLISRTNNEHI